MPDPHDRNGREPAGRVFLASAPWPMFNRPSIQLGSLKAYLNRFVPQVHVETAHLYLTAAAAVGYQTYGEISKRTWLAEPVYAAMLYPERKAGLEKLFRRHARGRTLLRHVSFDGLVKRLKDVTDGQIAGVNWGEFDLAGFTVSLCQLSATLYCLKSIKQKFPSLTTVVGGGTFAGGNVRDYLKAFPDIDYIVRGEGERPLSLLVRRLCGLRDSTPGAAAGGGVGKSSGSRTSCGFSQLDNLRTLPPPDYDEYFETLQRLKPEKRFFATLPLEASRGCWWQGRGKRGGLKGCAFCNLNLQWQGYRAKESGQVQREIDGLTSRHRVLSVAFADNVLPSRGTGALFDGIRRLKKKLKLFGEIRPSTSRRALEKMRAAGMKEVQIGIEALSSSLLRKMNKGVNAATNLEIMRNCEALGIRNDGNLIVGFPGSGEEDVAQTLAAIDYAEVFRPLKAVRFWLGLGSPVFHDPAAYGLRWVGNHPNYRRLFPADAVRSCRFAIQSWRGGRAFQQRLWRPVIQRVREWEKAYAALHRDPFSGPVLSYRDGGSFLIIRRRCGNGTTEQHRISGISREIYLFCQKPSGAERIRSQFPDSDGDLLTDFLDMMKEKRLMFEDGGRYLSLAGPEV